MQETRRPCIVEAALAWQEWWWDRIHRGVHDFADRVQHFDERYLQPLWAPNAEKWLALQESQTGLFLSTLDLIDELSPKSPLTRFKELFADRSSQHQLGSEDPDAGTEGEELTPRYPISLGN